MGFDTRFDECILDYGNLSRMTLSGLVVHHCRLREANLDERLLKETVFSDADLQSRSLRRADLRGADLSGANHLAVALRTCQLGDTTISLDSAHDALALLGVTVT